MQGTHRAEEGDTAGPAGQEAYAAQLGQLINEKPNVIQEYENGKAIPAPAVLSKLSRVLGVQLSVKRK